MAATFKPPATQRVYDACILGGGLGGAAAGALLARRGFRVLLLDAGGRAPPAQGGWLLPAGPALLPSTRQLPAAEALLSEVGLANDAARALEPLSPDLQLLLPRHRLELGREPAVLAAELRREWPAQAAALLEALGGLGAAAEAGGHFLRAAPPLPPAGFLDGFALRKALKVGAAAAGTSRELLISRPPLGALADHPVGAAVVALTRFLAHLDGPPAPLALARLGGAALKGLHRAAPGAATLEEALRRKVVESRGEVLGSAAEPVRLESLGLEGGRLTTVRLAGSTDAYLARAYVLAAPVGWLLPLLPAAPPARAQRALARVRPGRRLAGLHLVVRPAALPPGLGPAALLLSAAGGPDEAVLVEVAAARREGKAVGPGHPPEAERLVSLWTLAEAGQAPDPAATARLEAALAEVLPFHQRHLVHRAGPLLSPHLLAVDEPALGVAGLPVRSPWKNLLLGSREVVPGLGHEGELYAGLQAAVQVAALLGAKDRPR
ncbi:MAG: NAD(P)-binding protein [Anaeromyxobacter sp.]|nr:NAD(P)-binding protein [Anaeromyxobacter sp.]MBL0276063.1 NAD(P)-binding protein [Anaeromyxobacter sp.]